MSRSYRPALNLVRQSSRKPLTPFSVLLTHRQVSSSPPPPRRMAHHVHPDFKTVEASRPPWDASLGLRYSQTVDPSWAYGQGANAASTDPSLEKKHIPIDPYGEGRPAGWNYRLLISAVVPRPIAFLSTRSADGAVTNLAPSVTSR